MTEQEWDHAKSVLTLFEAIPEPVDPRRMRLWGAACARSLLGIPVSTGGGFHDLPQWIPDGGWLPLVEAVEVFADRGMTVAKLEAFRKRSDAGPHNVFGSAARTRRFDGRNLVINWMLFANQFSVPPRSELAARLRDIFGNPFRSVSFSDSWRTTTAVSLAKGMHDSRDFDAMPLLADSLEDAGCMHPDILEHCRGAGPHVRGCWVVDLVLNKS